MVFEVAAGDDWYWRLTQEQRDEFCDWLERETPERREETYSVRLGEGFVVCTVEEIDKNGDRVIDWATKSVKMTERIHYVRTLPPYWPKEGHAP